jgi:hypothetical protein
MEADGLWDAVAPCILVQAPTHNVSEHIGFEQIFERGTFSINSCFLSCFSALIIFPSSLHFVSATDIFRETCFTFTGSTYWTVS